jgi:hypothetical protein
MQHFNQFVQRHTAAKNKKNAGMKAGVGIILQKDPLFFEEYATWPGSFGLMNALKKVK